jgi:hypothetical protein
MEAGEKGLGSMCCVDQPHMGEKRSFRPGEMVCTGGADGVEEQGIRASGWGKSLSFN